MRRVELPVFSGPLDLLLDLIQKEELEISTVALAQVTDQYLAHIYAGGTVDPDELADFIVIAARLLLIKSARLLPQAALDAGTEADEPDPGEDLAELLEEYRKFRELALHLGQLERARLRAYPRLAPLIRPLAPLDTDALTTQALLEALKAVVERNRPELEEAELAPLTVSIADKIGDIRTALTRQRRVTFTSLLEECRSRLEMVVCFLGLLELLREGRVAVLQEAPFAEIYLEAV